MKKIILILLMLSVFTSIGFSNEDEEEYKIENGVEILSLIHI